MHTHGVLGQGLPGYNVGDEYWPEMEEGWLVDDLATQEPHILDFFQDLARDPDQHVWGKVGKLGQSYALSPCA